MQKTPTNFKFLVIVLLLLNIVLIGFLTYILSNHDDLKELDLSRINILDKSGKNRIVISNEDRIPPPIIKGKTYERKVSPAGLIFYDKMGDERGGIAISENNNTNLNALAFDYQNADAIGIFAQDDKQNSYFKAGLIINDKDLSGKPGRSINRINLVTENGNASLVINDSKEIPRLILKVDSLGNPTIEMFDKNGKRLNHGTKL